MNTFRAAYLAPAQSAGVLMTTADDAHLSDAELTAIAIREGAALGMAADEVTDMLVIGDWQEAY